MRCHPLFCAGIVAVALVGTSLASASDDATVSDEAYANGVAAFESGDLASALRLWTPLADGGDARSQFGLGLLYEQGGGSIPPDGEAALRWYRLAARQGLPAAQNNLGLMFAEGRGAPRDVEFAVSLWRQAAGAGHAMAQYNLAVALEHGAGVPRDEREARQWLHRAAAQGLEKAEASLRERAVEGEHETASVEVERSLPAAEATATSDDPAMRPGERDPKDSPDGTFQLQLASMRSRADAAAVADQLAASHPDALATLHASVRKVRLGDGGTWYRVLFGPLPDRDAARARCREIRASAGRDCIVVAE